MFKYTALGIVMLVAIVLIYAFFSPKSVLVEADIVINRPVQDAYIFFSHLKNQDLYNRIRTKDPAMAKDLKGEDGAVGFIYAWSSEVKEVGIGEQEITRLVPFSRIETVIRFKKPFASNDPFTITTEQVDGNHTRVRFSYLLSMSYPTNIMLSFFSEKVRNNIQVNLKAAKSVLEKTDQPNS